MTTSKKMEDDIKKNEKRRRPTKKIKLKTTSKNLKMEDDLNCF